jgi:hypothetical protein
LKAGHWHLQAIQMDMPQGKIHKLANVVKQKGTNFHRKGAVNAFLILVRV